MYLLVKFDSEIHHILQGSIGLKTFCPSLVSDLFFRLAPGSGSRNGFTVWNILFPWQSEEKVPFLAFNNGREAFPLKSQRKYPLHLLVQLGHVLISKAILVPEMGWMDFSDQLKLIRAHTRNSMDLTEEEDIKRGWQEYTEELYKTRS